MHLERRALVAPDGTRLSFLDSGGTGRLVVILHGLAGSAEEFAPTARALPDHRVVLLDQRGHGHSEPRPSDVSREAFVADVAALLEREGPAILVGQSMGAHTAMLVAAAHPELVDRLVLLETAEGGDGEVVAGWFRSWPLPFADRDAARAFLGDGALADAWIADLVEGPDGLRPRFDPEVMARAIEPLAVPRWAEWEAVAAPTLLVYGEHGMFAGGVRDAFAARGRDVRRVDLPGGSHDAHLDAAEGWIAALREFVGGPA
ncbi:alpha/beta hydrolase [Rathayibacter caricis DSM 15933]|uniref:Alpha/beta hydrolase n=1 Tax=Rathayibacter caricis DSM 15933 TaxID=1328867 RepID=A0A2T4US91_9MICO|nr:alpha/beta hydrolase [Rathayibacter caricis]PTL72402.1 alpha/beta hydrolase [Rathayibacter caricis DSM 15933]